MKWIFQGRHKLTILTQEEIENLFVPIKIFSSKKKKKGKKNFRSRWLPRI
jgi:hypothetical protein